MLNEFERGWLSAAIDGEGSISLLKGKKEKYGKRGFCWRMEIIISNTNREFLEYAREICGGSGRIWDEKSPRSPKPIYNWRMTHPQVKEIFPQLNFIVKKSHAQCILEALECIGEHKSHYTPNDWYLEELYLILKDLNSRGKARMKAEFKELDEMKNLLEEEVS